MSFDILRATETDYENFLEAAQRHLETLYSIKGTFQGVTGEEFLQRWINVFSQTGSPTSINLDHNVAGKIRRGMPIDELRKSSEQVFYEIQEIVKGTAGHISAYKMNSQSELSCLIAGRPEFVTLWKKLYADTCEEKFGVRVEPVIWLDRKLPDIPNTTLEEAKIHFALGYDAIHCMPQMGPDIPGGLQLAAEEMGGGTIHVINMTHSGYSYAVANYYQPDAVNKMRRNALGGLEFPVDTGRKPVPTVRIRATGTIEPANRPHELYQGLRDVYGNRIFIMSIGIGPQGALPGCALFAGATAEGIGRFIFGGEKGLDTYENMQRKARACKRGGLLALTARYSNQPYPLDAIMTELEGFKPSISDVAKAGLAQVYEMRTTEK